MSECGISLILKHVGIERSERLFTMDAVRGSNVVLSSAGTVLQKLHQEFQVSVNVSFKDFTIGIVAKRRLIVARRENDAFATLVALSMTGSCVTASCSLTQDV